MTYQSIIFDKKIFNKDQIKSYMDRNIFNQYEAIIETQSVIRFRLKKRDTKNFEYKTFQKEKGITVILELPNTKIYAFSNNE